MLSLASCVLLASVTLGADPAENLLAEYGDLVIGRWIGDVTLIADYPGVGKKGEKVISHGVTRWIADKKGLESEWFGGASTGKAIIFWDPAAKKIVQYAVDSGGTISQFYFWKEGDTWVFQGGETLPDGSKTEGKGSLVVKDGGDTVVFEGVYTLNGKKLPDQHDVLNRVSK